MKTFSTNEYNKTKHKIDFPAKTEGITTMQFDGESDISR